MVKRYVCKNKDFIKWIPFKLYELIIKPLIQAFSNKWVQVTLPLWSVNMIMASSLAGGSLFENNIYEGLNQ